MSDEDKVLEGVRAMLRLAGEDPERSGLAKTPERVLKAWRELTGRPGDPKELLAVTFDDAGPVQEMVVVGPTPFVSLCEHHLMPFTGTAVVAYIPNGGVIGLSKIPRLVEHFARRPQVQERLTAQITEAIDTYATANGSACVIRATHSCASGRGVNKEAPMTTSSLTGGFRQPETRAEFLRLAEAM